MFFYGFATCLGLVVIFFLICFWIYQHEQKIDREMAIMYRDGLIKIRESEERFREDYDRMKESQRRAR